MDRYDLLGIGLVPPPGHVFAAFLEVIPLHGYWIVGFKLQPCHYRFLSRDDYWNTVWPVVGG